MDTTKNLNDILSKLLDIATDISRYQRDALETRAKEEHFLGEGADLQPTTSGAGLTAIARRLLLELEERRRYVPGIASSDYCWPIVLDLYIHKSTKRKVSITDACVASGAPNTTVLRWIGEMVEHGVIERLPDAHDRRRCNLDLGAQTYARISHYLAHLAGIEALVTPAQILPEREQASA